MYSRNAKLRCLLIILLLSAAMTKGQSIDRARLKQQRAAQEIESILDLAGKLDDRFSGIKIKAKAANLLWRSAPERSKALFLSLWSSIEQRQGDKGFEPEKARLAVLQYLYPLDPTLAKQLMHNLLAQKAIDEATLNNDRLRGADTETVQLTQLSLRLLESDPTLAAQILSQSLEKTASPMAPIALTRLREANPVLANYIALQALENLGRQLNSNSLIIANALLTYIFPLKPVPALTPETQQSDEILRSRFMVVGYQVLVASLAETDDSLRQSQRLSLESIRYRSVAQGLLVAVLAALSPSYAPQLESELNGRAQKFLASLPPELAQLVQFQAAVVKGSAAESDDLSVKIASARASGNFKQAQDLIDQVKDEKKRNNSLQLLLEAQCKVYILSSELIEALKTVRKIEDPTRRMGLLTEIAKAAHRKGDSTLSAEVLLEARQVPSKPDFKWAHVRGLFSLAAETAYFSVPEATFVLQDAIKEANQLQVKSDVPDDANNPVRLLDSAEMMRAFATLGGVNLEETLLNARRLENKAVEAMARLAAIEKVFKTALPPAKNQNSTPKTKTD